MRRELYKYEQYCWGQSVEELKQTVNFVKTAIEGYWKMLPKSESDIQSLEFDRYIEIHGREADFLIQYGFWRLQGIFEVLLKQIIDITGKTHGLDNIIKTIKNKGLTILKEDELKQWKDFRNNLTHQASERLNLAPCDINISDLEEYLHLLITIYEDLENQIKKGNGLK